MICGKSKVIDLILSRLIMKIPYNVYVDYCFYNKKWALRKDYIIDDFQYFIKYNPGVTRNNHDDKRDLVKKYLPYMHRKIILDTSDMNFLEFKKFVKDIDSFFYKPFDGDGGTGIQKYICKNFETSNLYEIIKKLKPGLLEETIKQHKEMNRLNPEAVSTLRVTIFKHKNGPKIIFSTLRTSSKKGSVVDNAASGGCFANVDIEKGEVCRNAYSECIAFKTLTKECIPFLSSEGIESHPLTGVRFKGFKIPFYKEALEMVLEMSNNIDFYGRRLIGFDVAITNEGPVIVEVNANRPDITDLLQTACKDIPMKSYIENIFLED